MNENLIGFERILLQIMSLVGLKFSIKEKKFPASIILGIFSLGFSISLYSTSNTISIGFALSTIGLFLLTLYGLIIKDLSISERTILVSMSTFVLIGNIFALEHWRYYSRIQMGSIMTLPMILIYINVSGNNRKTEFILSTIVFLFGIFRFISIWS